MSNDDGALCDSVIADVFAARHFVPLDGRRTLYILLYTQQHTAV